MANIFLEGTGLSFELERDLTIGRDPSSDISFAGQVVSWNHARICRSDGAAILEDLGSTNGTFLNGMRLLPSRKENLREGDVIEVGGHRMIVQDAASSTMRDSSRTQAIEFVSGRIVLGRDPDCACCVGNPQASWHHCEIVSSGEGAYVHDLDSTNGTYVNGARIREKTQLFDDDVITVASQRYRFARGELGQCSDSSSCRIDVDGLHQTTPDGKHVLVRDVSFTVPEKTIVAIVGPSGAGKTTLLNAMNGFRSPVSGWVLLNGVSFYDHLEELRATVGYVPQDDIVSLDLSVERVLFHAARLRLPEDTTPVEIELRVKNVLDELGLSSRARNPVRSLSGGERKRVNVAVELLSDPKILYLDEPTSGLDPGTEKHLFQLFNRLCQRGRTVVLVTHATENIAECDLVLFLAPGGIPIYYGPPALALKHFGVGSLAEIYSVIRQSEDHTALRTRFENSEYFERYVANRLADIPLQAKSTERTRFKQFGPKQFMRQFRALSGRYLEELIADKRNLALLSLQAPVIGLLIAMLFKPGIFDDEQLLKDGTFPIQSGAPLLFLMVVTCIWCGTNNAAREIVKEAKIYRRERMVNLQIGPYLLSKLTVLGCWCALQAIVLYGIVSIRIDFHLQGSQSAALLMWLIGTELVAMALGLLVSALASSVDQVGSVLPILLVPQVLFSGFVIPLEKVPDIARPLTAVCPSRWAFSALSNTTDIAGRYAKLPDPKPLILETFTTQPLKSGLALVLLFFSFILCMLVVLKSKETAGI